MAYGELMRLHYGERSICQRCFKPMSMTYGSGRYCGSFCAHSHAPANKGKHVGSEPSKQGWVGRRTSAKGIADQAQRSKRQVEISKQMWQNRKKDPAKLEAVKAAMRAGWAAKKIDDKMGWKA